MRNVTRYVQRLLRQRRPGRFVPTDEEAGMLAAAIALRSARPEDGMPRAEFLTQLRGQLAEQAARAGEDERSPVPRRPRRLVLVGTAAAAVAG
ncbi:MAG TPA: hypothetical protein VJT31_09660, partial [Rugosimonospora sp.]|nr:hypothetical protein [Rugosimonospora sp.]